jgi:WhiB family transcriptional regulator, redox-sensing transcriptional regulator
LTSIFTKSDSATALAEIFGIGAIDGPQDPLFVRDLPCHVGDPDLFFAERPDDLERAKQMCAACPVRSACLAGALERGEPWGVWGGEIFEHGVVIARKRPRGRPRKVAA